MKKILWYVITVQTAPTAKSKSRLYAILRDCEIHILSPAEIILCSAETGI